MKKFIFAVLVFLFVVPVFADGSYFMQEERIKFISATTPTDKSLDVENLTLRSGTSNARGFENRGNQGAACAMEIYFDNNAMDETTAGVTIVQQCSFDNENWFTPKNTSGTALGTIITDLDSDSYIQFTPVIAPYVRFAFSSGVSAVIESVRVIITKLP